MGTRFQIIDKFVPHWREESNIRGVSKLETFWIHQLKWIKCRLGHQRIHSSVLISWYCSVFSPYFILCYMRNYFRKSIRHLIPFSFLFLVHSSFSFFFSHYAFLHYISDTGFVANYVRWIQHSFFLWIHYNSTRCLSYDVHFSFYFTISDTYLIYICLLTCAF